MTDSLDDKVYSSNDKPRKDAYNLRAVPRRMTGQEWYDRFVKEMPRAIDESLPLMGYEGKVVEAAKRAAGLSE